MRSASWPPLPGVRVPSWRMASRQAWSEAVPVPVPGLGPRRRHWLRPWRQQPQRRRRGNCLGILAAVAAAGFAVVATSVVGGRGVGLGMVSVRRVRRAGLFRGLRREVWWCGVGGRGVGKRGLGRGIAGGAGIVDARCGGVRGALGAIAVEVGRIEGEMAVFRSGRGGVRKGFVVAQQVGGHGGTATNEHGDAGCGQQVRGHSTGSTNSRGDAETAGCGSAGGSGAGSSAAGNSGCGLCAGCGDSGHDGGATGDNA